ncbi:hypothetical protein SAMN06295909_2472 [Plantibacter sp. VKM Ac-1784]|uniref:ACT domain-containing protein n=1 Tax=Plantibacter elymi (nom. nud.) TaxID=199708 RepID=A0ABY1RFN5_9MICO|nr:hypothetical protein [Plantibacter sp. VKM Ac-1784]SMQ71172.1 hypothetical protein SAMN06295909_2472 [Plantibacter sp. VKM Ac-1784]
MDAEAVTTVEVVVSDDPTALSRIVRLVSTQPFSLTRLQFRNTPSIENGLVLMDVVAHGRAELLSKRLNRIVSVQRVRILDRQPSSPTTKERR